MDAVFEKCLHAESHFVIASHKLDRPKPWELAAGNPENGGNFLRRHAALQEGTAGSRQVRKNINTTREFSL
jgi:hypothetical protein